MSKPERYTITINVWKMPEGWWANAETVHDDLGIDCCGFGWNSQRDALKEVTDALSCNSRVRERQLMLKIQGYKIKDE